jgi:hypothetical protein
MSRIAYVNGRYVPFREASVHVGIAATSLVTAFMKFAKSAAGRWSTSGVIWSG